MSTQKLIPESITPAREFKGKQGDTFYTYDIKFVGASEVHQYVSKSPNQDKFEVGKEIEVQFVPNNNPNYPPKVKPVSQNNGYSGRGGGNRETFDQKIAGIAYGYGKDLVIAGIIELKDIHSNAEAFAKGIKKLSEKLWTPTSL